MFNWFGDSVLVCMRSVAIRNEVGWCILLSEYKGLIVVGVRGILVNLE